MTHIGAQNAQWGTPVRLTATPLMDVSVRLESLRQLAKGLGQICDEDEIANKKQLLIPWK